MFLNYSARVKGENMKGVEISRGFGRGKATPRCEKLEHGKEGALF